MAYRYGGGHGSGLMMGLLTAGGALADAIRSRREAEYKKKQADLIRDQLAPLYGDIPNMGEKISNLAKTMGGIGAGMPATDMMPQQYQSAFQPPNPLPTGATAGLPSNQMVEGGMRAQNTRNQAMQSLLGSLPPEIVQQFGAQAAAQQLFPQQQKTRPLISSDKPIYDPNTDEWINPPGYDPDADEGKVIPAGAVLRLKDGTVIKNESADSGKLVWGDAGVTKSGLAYERAGLVGSNGQFRPILDVDGKPIVRMAGEQTITGPVITDKVLNRRYQAALTDIQAQKGRVQRQIDTFDPEYLTYLGKGKRGILSELDKVFPLRPGTEAYESLTGATRFFRRTYEAVNLYIKYITGAQMGEAEAQRLMRAVANESDSPAEYITKLMDTMDSLKAVEDIYLAKIDQGYTEAEAGKYAADHVDAILSSLDYVSGGVNAVWDED